ncbi:ABC transporter B family member 17 isoform X6 [Arachis hypogaea]|uniref:ABC transporter B family member 17 isoform X6 n=1 Tax=Arachis hypogaea TaxID=3818 RepID=UPI003B21AB6A
MHDSDGVDKLLMLFGTIESIGDGLQNPLMMYILSDVINAYGDKNSKLGMHDVNKYALRLLLVAIGVGLSAFVEGMCWARTAERQASRMKMEYLKSVLRQEIGFFDSQTAGTSTTYQVVSLISSDANTIQVALCEKPGDVGRYFKLFHSSLLLLTINFLFLFFISMNCPDKL